MKTLPASQHREHLIAAKAKYENLLKQRDRIKEKAEATRDNADSYRVQLSDAEKKFSQIEKSHILDEATSEELAVSRAEVDDLRGKLTEASRRNELIISALNDISAETSAVSQEIIAAHQNFCHSEKNRIAQEIGRDSKIREKMLEAYGAMIASSGGYDSTWHKFLIGIFQQPNQDEINAAVNKFIVSHNLERQ